MRKKIQLGDEVKHTITGFKGIAVAKTTYLSGCERITIQPKVKKDGTLAEAMTFDEPEIKVTKSKKIKENNKEMGGFKPEYKYYLKD